MRISFLLIIIIPMQLLAQVFHKENTWVLSSPDKNLKFILTTSSSGLQYSINFNNTVVIQPSALGLTLNGVNYGGDVSLGKIKSYKIDETYSYRGVHSLATNKCNGAKINISSANAPFMIEARAYNDGVAFRYIVNKEDSVVIDYEKTAFNLTPGSIIWSQPNIKHYEGRFSKKLIDTVGKGTLIGPPATIELPAAAGFASITEGGLTDFGGMSLISEGQRVLKSNLSGKTKKFGRMETPWRIIEVGKNLNTLVNCDIIANVSAPSDKRVFPKGYQTDWVKPGRSVWSWLSKTRAITLENMKHFSDMAAQLGFEYNLVDEGWGKWKDSSRDHWQMMKELVDYSEKKGVKIWVWKAYPDRGGIPGIYDAPKRKAFFQKCKELGIVGLKIDFFDSENQEIINFYQDALRDAAVYGLMINFHGANKPTGESRTWPNEMTREAVRGMENRPPWGENNVILPFTRYLAGHGDFTPIHFGDRIGEVTWAHHAASMIVFTSPFLCVGADPQSILDNPVNEMVKSIPATWDETIVMPQSKIGELVLYARRSGDKWFLAAMNGTASSVTIEVPLSFLKKGSHTLSALTDDETKQAGAATENVIVSSNTIHTIALNMKGGYVARIKQL